MVAERSKASAAKLIRIVVLGSIPGLGLGFYLMASKGIHCKLRLLDTTIYDTYFGSLT